MNKIKVLIVDDSACRANVHKLQKNTKKVESILFDSEYSKIEWNKEYKNMKEIKEWAYSKDKIILIGTSTGGPRALQTVMAELPEAIDAPILVVQHMPAGFTKSLAERLNSLCQIHVKEAEAGELIQKGTAYIAPGGYHLKVRKVGLGLAIVLDQSQLRNGHRPSVDVMFESVSEIDDYSKIAVIMTGMGSDGANGLIHLKERGQVKAIAESQETSIVFGMPKAAIATHLVDNVEDVGKIAKIIVSYCSI